MVETGNVFGIIDLVPETKNSVLIKEVNRMFSVLALDHSEVLCLSIEVITMAVNNVRTFRRCRESFHL